MFLHRFVLLSLLLSVTPVRAQAWFPGGAHASASASASSSHGSASATAIATAGNGSASAYASASASGNGHASAHASASTGWHGTPTHPGHHQPAYSHPQPTGSHATSCVNGICNGWHTVPNPTPAPACRYASYDNYNQAYLAAGYDLKVLMTDNSQSCLVACSCDDACVGYTYNTQNRACYLKAEGVDETPYVGAEWVSGLKYP